MGVEVRGPDKNATPGRRRTSARMEPLDAAGTDQKVVKSIVDVAHSLDKKTIAEGVENAATLTALKDRGVDYAQGFYLGRPKRFSSVRRARDSRRRQVSPRVPDGAAGIRQ